MWLPGEFTEGYSHLVGNSGRTMSLGTREGAYLSDAVFREESFSEDCGKRVDKYRVR